MRWSCILIQLHLFHLEFGMSTPNINQYLIFTIGKTNYAVELRKVQEIREFSEPTKLITSVPEVLGALDLRGSIVPLMDLRVIFGQSEIVFNASTVVILIAFESNTVGFVVDKVKDVAGFSMDSVMKPPFEEKIPHIQFIGIATHPTEGMVALIEILETEGAYFE